MKIILFNQNPMITKLLESVSKKLELSMEDFNRYQELSTRLKEDPEWILIADDECLEKLDQVDWLELKEIISQNKNSVCMYKKGNEAQPFLEGFEMKIKKPFLPTEVLKVLQKKLGSNASELEPSQNLDPTQEVLETNWDELENLGDLEALVQEEPNNEEQLLPTLNNQKEKEEVKETPQEEEKPKDDEIQEGETLKDEEVSKELETQEEIKEETQEQAKEQEPIKEETQEIKEEKQEKTQDSPSAQELEAMQELVKEIQENSNGQEDKKETQEKETQEKETQEKETQESAETPQEKEKQELETPQETPQEKETQKLETPQEETKENAKALQETQTQELETPQEKETQKLETPQEEIQENTETPQELEKQELETQEKTQESAETPQDVETPQETPQEKETQKLETPQEEIQENTETPQKLETQEDHYESIEDIPEPVMAQAMGEELPFLNEAVAKIPNNENDTETPKESVIKTPQEKEESDKTSNPLELRLNLQDLLKSLNQESLKSLLEDKTLSIKITLEDKKPDA
ncbi:chemotaxis regulatory protein ChePep [Helicobacter pylori]